MTSPTDNKNRPEQSAAVRHSPTQEIVGRPSLAIHRERIPSSGPCGKSETHVEAARLALTPNLEFFRNRWDCGWSWRFHRQRKRPGDGWLAKYPLHKSRPPIERKDRSWCIFRRIEHYSRWEWLGIGAHTSRPSNRLHQMVVVRRKFARSHGGRLVVDVTGCHVLYYCCSREERKLKSM